MARLYLLPLLACPTRAGHLKLEFVAPTLSDDKIATCLTSMRLDLNGDCSVRGCVGMRGADWPPLPALAAS